MRGGPLTRHVHVATFNPVKIVWDERKRTFNVSSHGIDFADSRDRFDFAAALIVPGKSAADGRARFKAIGLLDGDLVTVVFSRLGSEAISLISVRRASRKERFDHDHE